MGTPGVLLDKDKILKAIIDKKGIISHAATLVPCNPVTIYNWMDKDPEVAEAVKSARANADKERLDTLERLKEKTLSSAEALLDECDTSMTIFLMKSLLKVSEHSADSTINVIINEQPYRANNTDSPSV